MNYNFDEIIDRSKVNSKKWNPKLYKETFNGHTDLLPLWVADMDFRVAQPILDAMRKVIDHGVLGYTAPDDEYFQAIIDWNKKRKNCDVKKDWIVYTNGVVPALGFIVQNFIQEDENILIQTPVYPPFKLIPESNGRKIITSSLINTDGYYTIDFEDFERKIVDNNIKLFILCNPHNPVGRVWKKEELQKIGDICLKYNVLIISDEIHSDLIFKEHSFTSFLNLGEKYWNNLFVCTAPSKTFNLAGVQTSIILIPNNELKTKYQNSLGKVRIENPNTFGIEGVKAGYLYGEEWLEQVIDYLDKNRKFIQEFLEKNIPTAKYYLPEGTYLAWINLKNSLNGENMEKFFEEKAKVAIDYGTWFGPEGEGYIRLNFACPKSILEEALTRIANNLK